MTTLLPSANEHEPVIIVNPTAGRGQAGRQIRAVAECLRGFGMANPVWRHTQRQGDATRFAAQAVADGAPLVVAVGGDGTLHEVVNGLIGSDATLGLIPFGTGNDFARSLGLYGELDVSCRAVAAGETRRIDVGTITGDGTGGAQHFLVIAGTGFDAHTARTVNEGISYLHGAPAFVWGAILTAQKFVPFQLTLTIDGGAPLTTEAMFVSLANMPMTGGGMKIAPDAQPDDGQLDICLVRKVGKLQMLWQLTKIFDGSHVRHPAVSMLRGATITLDADPPQPLLIDGEVCGSTPATVTIRRQLLPVKVPAL